MIADFAQRKWEQGNSARDHKPEEAITAALRELKEYGPCHCIVIMARKTDDGVGATWFQAGDYNAHAQLGLMERVKADIIRSGDL